MHLHLAARYEREQGLLDSKRRSELLSQVVRIAEALHAMPAASFAASFRFLLAKVSGTAIFIAFGSTPSEAESVNPYCPRVCDMFCWFHSTLSGV